MGDISQKLTPAGVNFSELLVNLFDFPGALLYLKLELLAGVFRLHFVIGQA